MNPRMLAKKNLFKGMKDHAMLGEADELRKKHGGSSESEDIPGAEPDEGTPEEESSSSEESDVVDHNEPQIGPGVADMGEDGEQMDASEDSGVKVTIEGVSPDIIEKLLKSKLGMGK